MIFWFLHVCVSTVGGYQAAVCVNKPYQLWHIVAGFTGVVHFGLAHVSHVVISSLLALVGLVLDAQ